MKTLTALLAAAAMGLALAASSYANCGADHKTAKTTGPAAPAPSTPAPVTTSAG